MSTISLSSRPSAMTLTKVWGRNYAADRVAAEITRAERDSGYRFSIALIKLDGLGRLSYRLGHAAADDPWPHVLGLLTRGLGADDLCCRLSTDEFLLILPARDERACLELSERLHRAWSGESARHDLGLELSIGVAAYPGQGSTVGALFAAADEAMDDARAQAHAEPFEQMPRSAA
jgi:diguanylate cyclase (GGDEF)-like protein